MEYPKDKFGSETTSTINTVTGATESIKDEVYNGGVTRKLSISEDSIKIDDEKSIVEKVFDMYKQKKDGRILGFSVNAEAYNPQTFNVSRIIVRTIKFADK